MLTPIRIFFRRQINNFFALWVFILTFGKFHDQGASLVGFKALHSRDELI